MNWYLFNRFIVYSKCEDNEIIIFLDGDDWLSDCKCLTVLNNIYNENDIKWSISNHKVYKDEKLKVIPSFVNLPLESEKPKICHLRSGYLSLIHISEPTRPY